MAGLCVSLISQSVCPCPIWGAKVSSPPPQVAKTADMAHTSLLRVSTQRCVMSAHKGGGFAHCTLYSIVMCAFMKLLAGLLITPGVRWAHVRHVRPLDGKLPKYFTGIVVIEVLSELVCFYLVINLKYIIKLTFVSYSPWSVGPELIFAKLIHSGLFHPETLQVRGFEPESAETFHTVDWQKCQYSQAL